MVTRRHFLQLAALAACKSRSAPSGPAPEAAPAPPPEAEETTAMMTRPIPRTGEELPVIGLGTWQTFDVAGAEARAPLVEVMRTFLDAGGRVIDSSPMYGRSEQVTGDVLAELDAIGKPFLATKVWTTGKREGIAEMKRSIERMRAGTLDLMQVHNLVDWKTHLPVLREWKQAGTIRYLGVTHYAHGAFDELEQVIETEALDFVQLPYNLADRTAEQRLLPAAQATGTAVIVMQPFESGELFDRVRGKDLPAWAGEIDCTSWAQVFLKFILGHPAVTCPIPATSKAKHAADNVRAGFGRLPDEAMRETMIRALE